MSVRLGFAVAAGVVVAATVLGLVVLRSAADGGRDQPAADTGVAAAYDLARAASAPFTGFTEMRLALGDRCLLVAVADEDPERHEGLRAVTDLGDYDGMLFVYGADTDARFTMANTPLSLDIAWYDSTGNPVDRTTMQPCLDGGDAECPVYASTQRFRYALETAAGDGGAGSIGACP